MLEDQPQNEETIACPGCGYDLSGHLPADRSATVICPECGSETRIERVWRVAEPPRQAPGVNWRWWALAVMPAFAFAFCGSAGALLEPIVETSALIAILALITIGALLLWGRMSWVLFRGQPTAFRLFWLLPHVLLLAIVNAVVVGVLLAVAFPLLA